MRIAIVNWTTRLAGGAETYLRNIIPGLQQRGHTVAFLHECDEPADRESVALTDPQLIWNVSTTDPTPGLANLFAWKPDVVLVNGLRNYDWVRQAIAAAPSVFFCQDYAGICISGYKTFQTLGEACERSFGWPCLVHYYPFRCGGLSPVTMLRDYAKQSDRLALLRLGNALVTASEFMRQQFIHNGFPPDRVYLAPLIPAEAAAPSIDPRPPGPWRLLFAGRMEWTKGGDVFIDALPAVRSRLGQPVRAIFSGDGRLRRAWEQKAAAIEAPGLTIEFAGWQPAEAVDKLLGQVDLVVLPSLWPEPFGLIGVEAGSHGVPVAAFETGGIPDWLTSGVNGFLASSHPPTASGLAAAIVRCLENPDTYLKLRSAARTMALRFSTARHIDTLEHIFTEVLEKSA